MKTSVDLFTHSFSCALFGGGKYEEDSSWVVGGLGKCEMPARRDTMEEFDDGRLNPCTRVNIYLQNIQCKTSASQLWSVNFLLFISEGQLTVMNLFTQKVDKHIREMGFLIWWWWFLIDETGKEFERVQWRKIRRKKLNFEITKLGFNVDRSERINAQSDTFYGKRGRLVVHVQGATSSSSKDEQWTITIAWVAPFVFPK